MALSLLSFTDSSLLCFFGLWLRER